MPDKWKPKVQKCSREGCTNNRLQGTGEKWCKDHKLTYGVDSRMLNFIESLGEWTC